MIKEMLERHEGRIPTPYQDSLGIWTVGIGHNMNKPLSDRVIDMIFEEDLQEAIADCSKYDWFKDLDRTRKNVIIDMMFNLGATRFAKFHNMITAISIGDYPVAANEMLDSKWAFQVGRRATELAEMMRTGQ